MKISQQYPEKMDQEQEELSLSYSELNIMMTPVAENKAAIGNISLGS